MVDNQEAQMCGVTIHRSLAPEHLSFRVSRLSRLSVPFPRSPASQFRRVLPTTTSQPTPPQVCTLLLSYVRCSITVYGCRTDGATGHSLLIMIPPGMSSSPASSPTPAPKQEVCPTCGRILTCQICKSNRKGNRGRAYVSCFRQHSSPGGNRKCEYFHWLSDLPAALDARQCG